MPICYRVSNLMMEYIVCFFFFLNFFDFTSYNTNERTIFDKSGMVYTDAHIDNRIECSQLTNSNKNCIQMKSEPSGASSPESSAEISTVGPDDCAGCGRLIQVIWSEQTLLFDSFIFIFPHKLLRKKSMEIVWKLKNKIFSSNFFHFFLCLYLNWIRIVFIYRPLKSDGTQLVFNVMYVNSCLKVKHRVFREMEIFIVNQTTTGMCQNELLIHTFNWLDKNIFFLMKLYSVHI